MTMSLLTPQAGVWALVVILLILWRSKSTRKTLPLPPGPPALPLLGNMLQYDKSAHPHLFFEKLGKKYGDISSFQVPGMTIVILNSIEAQREVLLQHGAESAHRMKTFGLWRSCGPKLMTFLNDDGGIEGRALRAARKLLGQQILDLRRGEFDSRLEAEAHYTALQLLERPSEWKEHFARYPASVITWLNYGFSIDNSQSKQMWALYEINAKAIKLATPDNFLVNQMPQLARLPLPAFLKTWEKLGDDLSILHAKASADYAAIGERNAAKGNANWYTRMRGAKEAQDLVGSSMNVADISVQVYGAGGEAISGHLLVYALAACLYPERLMVVREQLHTVCGLDRPPRLSDMPRLPLVTALVNEVLRWRPAGNIGIPHVAREDIVLAKRGICIPKGSMIMANVWAAEHDPAAYKKPMEFDILANQYDSAGELRTDSVVFGVGKRSCAGEHLARRTLWIILATLVWAFDVKIPAGEQKPSDAPEAFSRDIVSHPPAFQALFVPRSSHHEQLIRGQKDSVAQVLNAFEQDEMDA